MLNDGVAVIQNHISCFRLWTEGVFRQSEKQIFTLHCLHESNQLWFGSATVPTIQMLARASSVSGCHKLTLKLHRNN